MFNFRKDLSFTEKQFEKYTELMRLAYRFPNEVTTICMRVIISIHVMSGADDATLKEILKDMYYQRQELGSREDIIKEHMEESSLLYYIVFEFMEKEESNHESAKPEDMGSEDTD